MRKLAAVLVADWKPEIAVFLLVAFLLARHASTTNFDRSQQVEIVMGNSHTITSTRLDWDRVEAMRGIVKDVHRDVKEYLPLLGDGGESFIAKPICIRGEASTEKIKAELAKRRLKSADATQLALYGLATRLKDLPSGYREISALGQQRTMNLKIAKHIVLASLELKDDGKIRVTTSLPTTSWVDTCVLALAPT